MNILFLMIIPPQIKGNPNLYTELMEEFVRNGHHVFVAAIDEKRNGRQTRRVLVDGVNMLYVKTGNMFNVNPIEKGLTTLSLGSIFKSALNRFFSDVHFDIVIMPTPPITFAKAMNFVKCRDGAMAYLILRDIFPQNAVDIGLLHKKLIFNFFRKKEKEMYAAADHIGCMSRGNIDYVVKHNPEVDIQKLELLPNWCHIGKTEKQTSTVVDYKKEYGLEEKFVCVFGGNIGWPQELEFLIELAKSVQDRDDIRFLIIGKGIRKEKIKKLVESYRLKNVIMLDSLPRSEYDDFVAQCDVGLINLDRRFTIPNIPSKTTGYFKAGLPVLASVDANTDYGSILDEANAGLWSITGDLQSYRKNLLFMVDNPQMVREMGTNGRRYLEENWTVDKAYHTIMKHIKGRG